MIDNPHLPKQQQKSAPTIINPIVLSLVQLLLLATTGLDLRKFYMRGCVSWFHVCFLHPPLVVTYIIENLVFIVPFGSQNL